MRPFALADVEDLWLRWNFDPVLVLGIVALVVAYWYVQGPLRRRYAGADEVDPRQPALFAVGMAVFIFALMSPLDAIGDDYLFSVHMVQHMLLCVVVPPLWVLATPRWALEALLRRPGVLPVARLLTNPIVAFAFFNGDLWLWHLPALYDATLTHEPLHVLEHLTFVATALLFWMPVLSPAPALRQLSPGASILYLFVACQPMVALGALLTFSAAPLYHPYVVAPRIWGSTALGDQQLGGLIMWLPSNIPYLAALSVLFFRWVSEQDRRERAAAGEFDALDGFDEQAQPGMEPADVTIATLEAKPTAASDTAARAPG